MYVPKTVIDQHIANPGQGLQGENRVIAVLSSDIRGFTSISEPLQPDELVRQLNRYFAAMVEVIDRHGGFVDKYIGDAIKALFGAPDRHEDDALRAVRSALGMIEALEGFNREQAARGNPAWNIGIGVAYGMATVGERGLREEDELHRLRPDRGARRAPGEQHEALPPALPDLRERAAEGEGAGPVPAAGLRARGHRRPAPCGSTRRGRRWTGAEREAWDLHDAAMEEYLRRDFAEAARGFEQVGRLLPDDAPAAMMLERCRRFAKQAPPPDWDGVGDRGIGVSGIEGGTS